MTPKQRMLAAYRGELPDMVPVAPEFWYYVPVKLLGVDMMTFEREVPFWQALQQTFRHYGTEGWGAIGTAIPSSICRIDSRNPFASNTQNPQPATGGYCSDSFYAM